MLGTAAAIGIAAGSSLLSGVMGSKAAGDAADAQREGSQDQIDYLRESRDLARSDTEPYRVAGYSALDQALKMVGLPGLGSISSVYGNAAPTTPGSNVVAPAGVPVSRSPFPDGSQFSNFRISSYAQPVHRATGGPITPNQTYMVGENGPEFVKTSSDGTGSVTPIAPPSENTYDFTADPSYQARFNEGLRAVNMGAAAKGGALSGGAMKETLRYGQTFASTEYSNIFNRIAAIAGLGTSAANNSSNVAMQAGFGMGSAASDMGSARASGYLGQSNAWGNALNQGMWWLGNMPTQAPVTNYVGTG